ncbi:MAG: sulfite exporter TauE/SafE family protein [Candidatus Omnitrophica bacterium]|nr:sulfite exporter TauE/SafE family protein [Candidatus Omnitrophota bacterium]
MNPKVILSLFILGLSFGAGPCMISCGSLLICYSAGGLKDTRESFRIYMIFSLARVLVYLLFGLVMFLFGRMLLEGLLRIFARYIFVLGGGFIVFIGILVALGKMIESRPWDFLRRYIRSHDGKNTFLLGAIVGFLPCSPLIFILSYVIVVSRTWIENVVYLLSFGIGTFFSPLLLLSIAVGIFPRWLKEEKSRRIFSFICGIILVFLGFQLIKSAL